MSRHKKVKVITVTFDNRTNRVFFVKRKNAHTTIQIGELARNAITTLLAAGYKQRAELRGNTFSVLGFTKKQHGDS